MSLKWTDDYCLGIGEIDRQHKELFSMLAGMCQRYETAEGHKPPGKNKLQLHLDIWRLRKHVFSHFLTEEEYMIRYRYPGYFGHKNLHNIMVKEIFQLEDEIINVGEALPDESIRSFMDLLARHVIKADREFGNYLRDSGILANMLFEKKTGSLCKP